MADDSPAEARRVLFTTSVVTARSTFLAGFAYYEIGRYGFARGADTAYPVIMTFCFAFSVLAVALSAFVSFYLERSQSPILKRLFVKRIDDTFARWAYASFLFALLFYAAGLGRIGYVYYGTTSYKYVPLAILYTTIVTLLLGVAHIIRTQWLFWETDSKYFGLATEKLVDSEAYVSEVTANRKKDSTIFRKEETLEQLLINQCGVISGRAVYIAGFCNAGIARYITTDSDAGHAYLFFMCCAAAFAIIAAFLLSNICIFLNVTVEDKQHALAIMFLPIARRLFACYFASFFMLGMAVTLMGWGCGYPSQAWITASCGAIGTALLVVGAAKLTSLYQQAKRSPLESDSTDSAEQQEARDVVARTMVQINNIGSQATLASGFVFYNIVTFYTDILPLSSSEALQGLFLAVNAATVMFGLVSAVIDSLITVAANVLKSTAQRALFLKSTKTMVTLSIYSFEVSLLGFLVGFALYGVVKYNPVSYIPLAFTVFTIVCIVVFNAGFQSTAARLERSSEQDLRLATVDDAELQAELDAQTQQQPALLNLLAGRSLFFGGFAYFSVNFFFTGDRPVANAYLVFMSMAFCFSIAIVMLSTFYGIWTAYCPSQRVRSLFVIQSRLYFKIVVAFAIVAMVSFLVAFGMIGYVKTIVNYRDIAPVMVAGAGLAALMIAVAVYRLSVRFLGAANKPPSLEDEAFNHRRLVAQINVAASSASFVAGNVFFEILFSVANSSIEFANYYYFVMATATFVSGSFVVAMSTAVAFMMGQIVREQHRARFGKAVRKMKSLIFFLNALCFLTWIGSIIAVGAVKYDAAHGSLWQPSFSIGLTFLILMLLSLMSIKLISNAVVRAPATEGALVSPQQALQEPLLADG